MRTATEIRDELAELAAIVDGRADPQLRVLVGAYFDQAHRLLRQADEATSAARTTDAEILLISAQRWAWKIAKTCTLF